MPAYEIAAILVYLLSIMSLLYRRTNAAFFAYLYLSAWALMKVGLTKLGLYPGFVMPVFFGSTIDLLFIGVIALSYMETRVVLAALVLSNLYGSVCFIEDYYGGYHLTLAYGWVNVVLGAAVVTGGFFNDPKRAGVLDNDHNHTGLNTSPVLVDKVPVKASS